MNCKLKKEWVGQLAAIIGIIALLPIGWYVIFTYKYINISLVWIFLKILGAGLWLYFGLVNKITPNVILSIASLIVLFIIVIGKMFRS